MNSQSNQDTLARLKSTYVYKQNILYSNINTTGKPKALNEIAHQLFSCSIKPFQKVGYPYTSDI